MQNTNPIIISLIVAVAENGVIGNAGKLPWRLKSDLRRFRKLTMGHPIIMGRKTFQSIGKPLDGRDNIVVTSNAKQISGLGEGGFHPVPSWDHAKALGERFAGERDADEIFVIGGSQLFDIALKDCTRIYITRVHAQPAGDVFWPPPGGPEWSVISSTYHTSSNDDDYAFTDMVMSKR